MGLAAARMQRHQQQQQQGLGMGEGGDGGGCGGLHVRASGAPEVRSWVQCSGTLRRVSMGMWQDQAWANERRSLDRLGLGRVSGVVQGFG